MKTPHVHAELIKQWADDTSRAVQVYSYADMEWKDNRQPTWDQDYRYRFKPEPKPDYTMCVHVLNNSLQIAWGSNTPNLRLTFSGETHKLIKAEVL